MKQANKAEKNVAFKYENNDNGYSKWFVDLTKMRVPHELILRELLTHVSSDIVNEYDYTDGDPTSIFLIPNGEIGWQKRRLIPIILFEAETGLLWSHRGTTADHDENKANLTHVYSSFYRKVTFPNQVILTKISEDILGAGNRLCYTRNAVSRYYSATNATEFYTPIGAGEKRKALLRAISSKCKFEGLK